MSIRLLSKRSAARMKALLVFFFCYNTLYAQSPGGVNANLKAWFKVENGVIVSAGNVTSWNNTAVNPQIPSTTANGGGTATLVDNVPQPFNFNSYINCTNKGFTKDDVLFSDLVSTTAGTMIGVGTVPDQLIILAACCTGTSTSSPCGSNRCCTGTRGPGSQFMNANTAWSSAPLPNANVGKIYGFRSSTTGSPQLENTYNGFKGTGAAATAMPSSFTFRFAIGSFPGFFYNGKLTEIVIYNRQLTAQEFKQVESYLAVKYGTTLGNTTTGVSYINSAGADIWTPSATYQNNITGIGRDDASALMQKQSRSVNVASLVTIYNGTTGGSFPAMNVDNTTSFSSDRSFLLFGDNMLSTTPSLCVMQDKYTAMPRVWKVQKSGTGVGTVTLALNPAEVPANVKTLLVSSDPTFATGTAYPLSTAGGMLSATATLNDGQYFTFATEELLVPTATNVQVCPGNPTTLTVASPQTGVTYSWYNVATGGTALATGNSYTIPAVAGPTTIYIEGVNASGCKTAPRGAVNITIYQQLPSPVVTVTGSTFTTISYAWTAVPGATGYQVSVDGGTTWITPSSGATGLTHTITGLDQDQEKTLQVRALGAQVCMTSNPGSATGRTLIADKDIFIPNVFTPNGDGKNDQLLVYGYFIESMEMRVFNQWGELIFETKDKSKGWDGKYKNQLQPVGVYLYVVKVTLRSGSTITKTGSISLIR